MAMQSPRTITLAPAPAGPPSELPCVDRPAVSLEEAPIKRVWRKRQHDPAEEAELAGSKSSRVKLQSVTPLGSPPQPAAVEFHNQSTHQVRCLWLDFEGDETPYTVLQPGETRRYMTWAGHAWIARELSSARRMCLNGSQAVVAYTAEGHRVCITEPPALPWQEGTHCAFPQQFRQEVQQLLLCWQRLNAVATAGSTRHGGSSSSWQGNAVRTASAEAANLGSLPFDLVRQIMGHLHPADLWQEACAACHPGIQPVQVHSRRVFRQLLKGTQKRYRASCLPPASSLAMDQLPPVAPAPAPPAERWASPLRSLGSLVGALLGH